jgi:hypothetical protein
MKKNRLLRNENESSLSQYILVPILRDPLKRKALVKKCEKESESEGKKKKRNHFRNCAFLFSSGDTTILHFISDGLKWVLSKE